MSAYVIAAVALAVPLLACWCVLFLLRGRVGRQPDALIAKKIAANKATPRAGMEAVDWQQVGKVGAKRWQETLKAQHRNRRDGPADIIVEGLARFGRR